MVTNKEDKSGLAIGGMTLVGVGVGLIFIKTNAILMAASIVIGIGLGLVIAAVISDKKEKV